MTEIEIPAMTRQLLCGLSGSERRIGHAALDEGVANVKHFTGIRENRA
jgi:hypothetical protein